MRRKGERAGEEADLLAENLYRLLIMNYKQTLRTLLVK
jgi:hypothetical protein